MGRHLGWRVRPDRNRFRAEVLVPGTGRYRSQSFASAKEAKDWAQGEAAKVVTGMPSVVTGPRHCHVADHRKDYLDGLAARGRSPSHLRNVTRTVDGLAAAAPDLMALGAGAAIERWLNGATSPIADNLGHSRSGKPLSPTSRNRMLVEARAFIHWLQRRDYLDKDPTRMVEKATEAEALKPQFSLGELVHLLAQPTPDPAYWRRFALLTYAGLRSDEASALTWADVDLPGRCVVVRRHDGFRLKRGRERIVPLQPELAEILGPAGMSGDPVVAREDVVDSRRFARFLARCGIPAAGRTPHSCRHTYAGLMTATGVPGALLGAYLGHSSADTTAIYTKLAARYAQAVGAWGRGEFRLR